MMAIKRGKVYYCRRISAAACLAATVLLSGCSSIMPQAPAFYLLTPVVANAPPSLDNKPLVQMKPVALPKYLDSARIMTRKGDNRLDQAAAQLWAEPLENNFNRVLAMNLAQRLGVDRVYPHPVRLPSPLTLQVTVLDFIGAFDQDIKLHAHWMLTDDKAVLAEETIVRRQAVTGTDYAALVHAMSLAVGQLADHIVEIGFRQESPP